eukprot:1581276-Pleurochrysis_carterae.AAC.1
MEGPGPTSNAGALHISGLRSTKSHIVEQFRLSFSHFFCVDRLVEALRCDGMKYCIRLQLPSLWTLTAAFILRRRNCLERHCDRVQDVLGEGGPAATVYRRRADRT